MSKIKALNTSSVIEVLNKGFVRLVDHLGNDSSVVNAARVSYGTNSKKISEDRDLINYLMRHQHTSPFEMCELVFHIKLPIFVMRQLVRHRTASLNEISGRYSVLPDEYYIPEENKVTFQNPTNKQGGTEEVITPLNIKNPEDWWDCITPEDMVSMWSWKYYFERDQEFSRVAYEKYINSGMRKELARINLPLAQYTECYWKMDLRNLFHFLKLRLDSHSQYEIRVYAEAILDLIRPLFPLCVEAFENYILNSVTLSNIETLTIKNLLKNILAQDIDINEIIIEEAEKSFSNKREKEEFLNKLKILIGN